MEHGLAEEGAAEGHPVDPAGQLAGLLGRQGDQQATAGLRVVDDLPAPFGPIMPKISP